MILKLKECCEAFCSIWLNLALFHIFLKVRVGLWVCGGGEHHGNQVSSSGHTRVLGVKTASLGDDNSDHLMKVTMFHHTKVTFFPHF